jgi:Prenyltransferase and squalene oxidase repeat
MRRASIVLASLLAIPAVGTADNDMSPATLRVAAQKGLELLEQTSPTFIKKGGCNSCHAQMLPAAAQAFARSRGIPTGETLAQLPSEVSEATAERYVEYAIGPGGGIASLGFELFAASMAHQPSDARIRAKIYFIKGMQQPEGHWRGGGSRPPLTFDDFTTTAYMIHALSTYAPASEEADTAARIDRARGWLLKAEAERTQERAFQLLGLAWSRANRPAIDTAVRGLQRLQRADGGWGQLPAMPTDAYATGIALYAMFEAGVPVGDGAYRAGLKYLLSTQAEDGTWHVKTRALPIQPYFESGYPYGHDQWISGAAAAYATLAISAAVEPIRTGAR